MMHSRFFTLSGATLLFSGLFVACGDGEPNDPGGTGGGGGEVECSLVCAGTCVDSQNDPSNCGACGQACGAAELCSEGECVEAGCREGQLVCGNACVTTSTDRNHCGACGTECSASEICEGGSCVPADCREGQVLCGDACTTVATDRANCGSCGTTCGVAELCVAGQCELSCTNGLIACGTSCVNPLADPQYCGATECSDGAGGASNGVECGEREACVIGECREYVRKWEPGEVFDDAGVVGNEQAMAADSLGEALVLYRRKPIEGDDESYRLYSMFFDPATKSWSSPVLVDPAARRVTNMRVVMTPTGDGLAVWVSRPNASSPYDVFASRWSSATHSWGDPIPLESVDENGFQPFPVLMENGEAIVAWHQRPSNGAPHFAIGVARTNAGEFQAPEYLPGGAGDEDTYGPILSFNEAGEGAMIYRSLGATYNNPVRRYVPGVGWTAEEDPRLAPPAGEPTYDGDTYGGDVVIDADGDITAIWAEYDSVSGWTGVWSNQRQAGQGWGTASLLPLPDDFYAYPKLGAVRMGGVFASVATDQEISNPQSIVVSKREQGVWGDVEVLATGVAPADAALQGQLVVDGQGQAHVGWAASPDDVLTATYIPAVVGWAPPVDVGGNVTGATSLKLAISVNGNAFASWVVGGTLIIARYD